MEIIYKIGSEVGTPLALAGFFAAIFLGITLAIINKLPRPERGQAAPIIEKVLRFAFILSLVALFLGVGGWGYAKYVDHDLQKARRVERLNAVDAFSRFVTTLRIETDRLIGDYPTNFNELLKAGESPDQAKETLFGRERRRIDEVCGGYQVGSSVRASFPEFNWDLFFRQGKNHYRDFRDAIHDAVISEKYDAERSRIRKLQSDYMHHLEQRLEELRDKVGLPIGPDER